MINKKGYLRMLEAIVAIVIIFGAVLVMMPKRQAQLAEMPADVDSTIKSVLEEAQTNEQFRTCLLLNNNVNLTVIDETRLVNKSNKKCLYDLLKEALPIFTPWNFGFAICPRDTAQCATYNGTESDLSNNIVGFEHLAIPATKSVYTKSTVISVPDILAKPFIVSGCCTTGTSCELNNIKEMCIPEGGKTIIIYIWER